MSDKTVLSDEARAAVLTKWRDIDYSSTTVAILGLVEMVEQALLQSPEIQRQISEAEKRYQWAPDKCPITQRPFFMWIEHHKTGEMVPTYGGPYDSYTIPLFDGEEFTCERFDHDAGGWLVDWVEGTGLMLVNDQSLVIDPENPHYDDIESFSKDPDSVKQLQKDAERYRWLLGNYAFGDGYKRVDYALNSGEAEALLNDAIDEAMELEP